MTCFIKNTNL